jgi:hypothetical protein
VQVHNLISQTQLDQLRFLQVVKGVFFTCKCGASTAHVES